MKTNELLAKYPLATEVIRKSYFDKMIASVESAKDIPEEFKQSLMNEAITDERLIIFIDSQPRTLFDVFDENDIIIYFMIFSSPEGVRFSAAIHIGHNEEVPNPIGKQYNTRKEAELVAVEAAFELLEERLKPIELPALEEN